MKKLQSTDYVFTCDGIPTEGLDVIYASESVIELYNEGFKLEEGQAFTRMTDLPMHLQARYLEALNN
jgi:hypothetical protein